MMGTPRLYDISRTVSPALAVWPGDAPFAAEHILRLREGASVNLTTLTLSAHTGSHADAPYHFVDDGPHPADLPLDPYLGPAHLVTVARRAGGILPDDLAGRDLSGVRRLLIRTWVSDLPDGTWPADFPYLTVALVDWLAAREVVLLGLDSPSVDAFDSTDLPCHHRLWEQGMVHLESLRLAGMPDGVYELIALPLKLAGVCGSPVRAVLRELPAPPGESGER
ncbi:MAG: cyclase family protein [Anaerolineae bacterium]|nr:cyclase family protein [Anaerolineae bacterium]